MSEPVLVPQMGPPFQCPDCGMWFANEHRCPPPPYATKPSFVPSVFPAVGTDSFTVRCTCHDPDRSTTIQPPYCPVHDVQVTYTSPDLA